MTPIDALTIFLITISTIGVAIPLRNLFNLMRKPEHKTYDYTKEDKD